MCLGCLEDEELHERAKAMQQLWLQDAIRQQVKKFDRAASALSEGATRDARLRVVTELREALNGEYLEQILLNATRMGIVKYRKVILDLCRGDKLKLLTDAARADGGTPEAWKRGICEIFGAREVAHKPTKTLKEGHFSKKEDEAILAAWLLCEDGNNRGWSTMTQSGECAGRRRNYIIQRFDSALLPRLRQFFETAEVAEIKSILRDSGRLEAFLEKGRTTKVDRDFTETDLAKILKNFAEGRSYGHEIPISTSTVNNKWQRALKAYAEAETKIVNDDAALKKALMDEKTRNDVVRKYLSPKKRRVKLKKRNKNDLADSDSESKNDLADASSEPQVSHRGRKIKRPNTYG